MTACLTVLCILFTGDEQSELFCSMTELAQEACKTAHNALQVLCDQVVAGVVTMRYMKILKQNGERVHLLCTAACIKNFSMHKWLVCLEKIERYIERVQKFYDLLDPVFQGMYYNYQYYCSMLVLACRNDPDLKWWLQK